MSLAAYSVESRLPVSLPLEPFFPRSFPLLAPAAFQLSHTPALYRCAALFCLPCLPPHATTELPAALPSQPLQPPLAP